MRNYSGVLSLVLWTKTETETTNRFHVDKMNSNGFKTVAKQTRKMKPIWNNFEKPRQIEHASSCSWFWSRNEQEADLIAPEQFQKICYFQISVSQSQSAEHPYYRLNYKLSYPKRGRYFTPWDGHQ